MPRKNPFRASAMKLRDGQRRVEHRQLDLDRALVGVDERVRRERADSRAPATAGRSTVRPAVAGRMAASCPVTFCSCSSVAARTRTAQSRSFERLLSSWLRRGGIEAVPARPATAARAV